MVERILSGVFLLSGWFILSSCLLHQYHFVDKNLTWTEAQTYCRQTYTDLATVKNYEEMKQLINTVSSPGYDSDVWIGLYTEINWRWSDGFTGSGAEFRNWDLSDDEPDFYKNQFCVSWGNVGWYDYHCNTQYPFICNNGTQLDPEFVFVNERKNWYDAQRYCRENHKDLATVKNLEEDQKVQNLTASGVYTWIGLFRDPDLYWSDGSRFSYGWVIGPNAIGLNTVMCGFSPLEKSGGWKFSSCEQKLPFVCHSLRTQQVVKLRLKVEDSMDPNDPAVKPELLKKLQDRLKENGVTGVTLKWREQPDGEVFHKEGKRKKTEL